MNLSERIAQLSPEQRRIFELKLKQQNIDILQMKAAKIPESQDMWAIKPAEKKEYYPLSTSQKRLYILNLFMDYSIKLVFQIKGKLDRARLQEIIEKLIERHESLRTSIEEKNGEPVQIIHDNVKFQIDNYESGIRPEVIWNRANDNSQTIEETRLLADFLRPFDLSDAPLLRVALIKLSHEQYLLVILMHHLVLDGVSMRILSGEFMRYYLGEEEKLPALKAKYRDFAVWQNRVMETGEYKKQETYWLEVFSGEIPVLNMPTDFPRPVMQSFAGKKIRFEIKNEILQALKKLALSNDATVYMTILAVYNTLLSRYSGQEDIVIGTISAGRQQREIHHMVGVFINPLALRNFPGKDKVFTGFLRDVKRNTLAAFKHQLYPFGDLLEKVIKKKDFSRNPLFDAMIVFQNIDLGSPGPDVLQFELAVPGEGGDDAHAQQDLCLWVEEVEGRILIDLEYCSTIFKKDTMERFILHFLALLRKVTVNPWLTLDKIEMIGDHEKQQILEYFNNTDTPFPTVHTLHQLFEQQAERFPDNTAVVGMDSRGRDMITLSYKELNKRSTGLAALLREKGVKPDTLVGIMLERSVELIAAVIGVLKAGGAYLPLEVNAPDIRIAHILADSASIVLLSNRVTLDSKLLNCWNGEIVIYDARISTSYPLTLSNSYLPNPSNLAYVIYTSGSTGKPKGVMVEHHSIVNAAFAWLQEYKLTEMEVILLQVANFSFDVFTGDLARVFSSGGRMVICPEEVRVDPPTFYLLVETQRISLFESTPSLVIPLMEYVYEKKLGISHLKLLIVGSDSVRGEDFKNLLSRFGTRMRIINSYGATEAAVDSSYYEESIEQLVLTGNVPIGKPMPNMKFFILDSYGGIQPIGIPGELYIGGKGVARGYLNKPELTAEKFINNRSYRSDKTNIFYKTGDLARWLSDGNVEFLGRTDHQVKIRGFRIELEEIEHRLASHKDIKEVVVLAKEDKNGNKSLCAYIVPVESAKNASFTVSALRAFLFGQLPDYMIPSHYIELAKIPLNANGKIDKNALLAFEGGISTGVEYVPPSNDIEVKLAVLWSEILLRDRVGIYDNFFDLGGQSLKAMRLMGRIKEIFHVKFPLDVFFQSGTIKGIAESITREQQHFGEKDLAPTVKFEKKKRRVREV